MEIDIRGKKVGCIDTIRFGDKESDIILDNGEEYILFEHNSRATKARILVKKTDIDNLIKALQKAKELW